MTFRSKMHKMWIFKISLFLAMLLSSANSAKILSLTFLGTRSFREPFDPIYFELAERGHEITIVHPVKSSRAHSNIREINLPPETSALPKSIGVFYEKRKQKEVLNAMMIPQAILGACRNFLDMSQVQDLVSEKFDLVIGTGYGNECSFGLIHKLNTSFILVSPLASVFFLTSFIGQPSPRSFVPLVFTEYGDNMKFSQKVKNIITTLYWSYEYYWNYLPQMDAMNRQYFGEDTPSSLEIASNVSLLLINSHLAVNYPKPTMPGLIDVGGAFCRPGNPLPKDLEDFVGSAPEGFIYFSMGSVLQGSAMPEDIRLAFLSVFRKLKQKVLWKWETLELPDKPKNVMLVKWAPQMDILGHANIRLFITHAGGLSISEATYHGVPVLAIPMFADQDYNAQVAVNKGFGMKLELGELNQNMLGAAVEEMLKNPIYGATAKTLSNVYRDRIVSPLDAGVYWIEYVLRHKGAVHLRSPARNLTFFEYYCLDVAILFLTLTAGSLYAFKLVVMSIFKRFSGARRDLKIKTT